MRFNSITFIIFYLIVYAIYRLFNKKYKVQNLVLLVSSYIFYGWWDARFLFLIVLSTFIDYCCSYIISYGENVKKVLPKAFGYVAFSIVLFLGLNWNEWRLNIVTGNFSLPRFTSISESSSLMIGSLILSILLYIVFYLICRIKDNERKKKISVIISIIANLTILGFFKYFNFFSESLSSTWYAMFGQDIGNFTINIILPVGISFYTFQTMSYTVDVYRGEMNASRSLLDLAVYVAFFPQLVAGPIERGKHLLPQFTRNRIVNKDEIFSGLWLIFWGFYKKVVIADNMAVIVNNFFSPYDSNVALAGIPEDGFGVIVAVWAFAFQIYGDFSGYTDIARGSARLMGFNIMKNFDIPYISRSPSEFWKRWHISLSSWLRDYLYIPLGGNRKGELCTYRNLFLTMLLGGLWHGAAWTFVLWGAFHGLILIIYRLLFPKIDRKPLSEYKWWQLVFQWVIMWNLTCFGWLVFRSKNLRTIWFFLRAVITNITFSYSAIDDLKRFFFFAWFLIVAQIVQLILKKDEPMPGFPFFARLNVGLFLACSLVFLRSLISQEFIYFAF